MGPSDVSACLDEELLAAFVSGGLDGTELARVEAHLSSCEDCLIAVAVAAGAVAAGPSEQGIAKALDLASSWERLRAQGPGALLSDRFELGELIAQGGMGAVYRGVDREKDRPVAIKLLKPEVVAEHPELLARFARESEILRQLDHPNIVKIIDASSEGILPYIVMEYVAGGSLRELLKRQPQLPIARALSIALELVDALARAHHLTAIHRDIKPENVLLALDGTPRLTDFGLARMGDQGLTRVDALVGTLPYLSPEALSGHTLDQRADIWAFGVMLFEMLAGHRPFHGDHQGALVTSILQSRPIDLESVRADAPVALIDLIARMLEKDCALRVSSTRQIGAELEAILKGIDGLVPLVQASNERGVELPTHAATPRLRRTSDNLPAPLTTFLGRQDELSQLLELMLEPSARLVTILGPGGAGKTSLAIETARRIRLQPAHQGLRRLGRDGVWLVALAALGTPELVVTSIAEAVGLEVYPGRDAKLQLIEHLRDRSLLLILDNFEHLLPSASIVSEILEAAPGISVLATSRERLNLRGETLFRVEGLQVPDVHAIEHALEYSATQLFLQGARRVSPGLDLASVDLGLVTRICRQVHGMPLGILLATAWVDTHSLQEISEEIQKSLHFLAHEQRDVPERQRSMWAAFDHSYNLLSDDERTAFKQLSVFRGGFTLQAAQVVASASRRTLASLVNKSMLHRDAEGRYGLHELLRQYGSARLGEATSECEAAQLRHCAHFADFVTEQSARLRGPQQKSARATLEANLDNVYGAWDQSLLARRFDLAEALLDGLEVCIFYRERVHEYRELIFSKGIGQMRAATSYAQPSNLLARLLAGHALMSGLQGEPDVARRGFDEADALLRASPDAPRAWALIALARGKLFGQRQMTLGWSLEQIEANQQRAHHILEAASDEWNTGWNEFILSRVQFSLGKPEAAVQSAEKSLARFEKMGDRLAQRLPHSALGFIALQQHKWDVAVAHYGTSLAIAEEFGHSLPIAFSHRYLSEVAWLSGRYVDAQRHGESAVAIFSQRQHPEQHVMLALLEQIRAAERARA